jgi:hypothetical protein
MWFSCGASKGVGHICKTYWSLRSVLVICLQQKLIIYASYIHTLAKSVGPKLLDPKDAGTMICQHVRNYLPNDTCHISENFNLHFYIYFNVTYKPKRLYTHLKLYVSIMILNTHKGQLYTQKGQ